MGSSLTTGKVGKGANPQEDNQRNWVGFRYIDEGSDPNKKVYVERISDMVQANTASLDIDFVQLSRHATALAIWTVDAPTQMLAIFNESAARVVSRYFPKYLENVHSDIYVRVTGLPVVEHLRDIRCVRRIHTAVLRVAGLTEF